jgi:hypothetical protein
LQTWGKKDWWLGFSVCVDWRAETLEGIGGCELHVVADHADIRELKNAWLGFRTRVMRAILTSAAAALCQCHLGDEVGVHEHVAGVDGDVEHRGVAVVVEVFLNESVKFQVQRTE